MPMQKNDLLKRYIETRKKTLFICKNLEIEDYVVQPTDEVSPIKWHLGHTSWFFEEIILLKFNKKLIRYNKQYNNIFNSYYKSAGEHWNQNLRGQLSRPTLKEIIKYRKHVDLEIKKLLQSNNNKINFLIELGINHEEQHQELIYMDIKYIFNTNPEKIRYSKLQLPILKTKPNEWKTFKEDIYITGNDNKVFSYDNERPSHKTYIYPFKIQKQFVSNQDYINFIKDKGYFKPQFWLSKGWEWINGKKILHPEYWHKINNKWYEFTLHGLLPIYKNAPVSHISYYEASAYAKWDNSRLPTEEESEVYLKSIKAVSKKSNSINYHVNDTNIVTNNLWWWTKSHYSSYPGFIPFQASIEEYNEKFMCNQFVLKGGCIVTPKGHHRNSYRNFYEPHQRWMFSGIRLVRDIK